MKILTNVFISLTLMNSIETAGNKAHFLTSTSAYELCFGLVYVVYGHETNLQQGANFLESVTIIFSGTIREGPVRLKFQY